MRGCAAGVLGEIGPSAADAIPALTEALKDPDHYVPYAAAVALKNIRR